MNFKINVFDGGQKAKEFINMIWNECVNCTTHTSFEGLKLPPVNRILGFGNPNIKQVLKLKKLADRNIGTITTAFPDGSVARETMTIYKNGAEPILDVAIMNSDGRIARACEAIDQPGVNALRAAIQERHPVHHICHPGRNCQMPAPNTTLKTKLW